MGDASEGGGGIAWKELLVDKSIDAVLIPVGLFAALWFQGWVDEKKEAEDYAALVSDFRTEVARNRDKARRVESDLGPVIETDDEKVLGPLEDKFTTFKEEVGQLSSVFDCLDLLIEIDARPPKLGRKPPTPIPAPNPEAAPPEAAEDEGPEMSDEEVAAIAECSVLFDKVEKSSQKTFPAIDLSPFYSYVVWQVYLSNGIRLFKTTEAKRLGLLLGEVYAAQREVEQAVDEIETLFNDTLMKSSGKLSALVAESGDLMPEDSESEGLVEARPRVQEMSQEAWEVRYEVDNLRQIVALKVRRLKEYVHEMNTRFDATIKALDAEIARTGGAPK